MPYTDLKQTNDKLMTEFKNLMEIIHSESPEEHAKYFAEFKMTTRDRMQKEIELFDNRSKALKEFYEQNLK